MSDHDDIEQMLADLGSTIEGGTMPRSAADARRRGDQIRRRTHTLLAAGAAAAVVAITIPVIALTTGDDAKELPPADPTPEHTVELSEDADGAAQTTIPDDFPLAEGLPVPEESGELDEPSRNNESMLAAGELTACGTVTAPANPADRLTTRATGADEGSARELQLFRTRGQAAEAMALLRELYGRCAVDESEPPYVVRTSVSDPGVGDEALAVERVTDGGVGRTVLVFVTVGNALLVHLTGDAGSDASALREEAVAGIEPVLAAMYAAFLPEADPDTTPDDPVGSSPVDPTIADDYPIDGGWPTGDSEADRQGPERGGGIEHTACGRTYEEPAYVDRLTASFTAPEDGRLRQLTTYATADDAVAAVASLRAFYDGCRREDTEPEGFVAHYAVRQTDVGGESWVIYQHYTYNGGPTTGIRIFHVIRVGLAVLVIEASNEGGASDDVPGEVDAQVAGMDGDGQEAIDALCAFTEAGC